MAADTPWPLKTPAELGALHGPTFTGARILTYRHQVEPAQPSAAPRIVIGVGDDFVFREEGDTRLVIDLRLGRLYSFETGKRYVSYPIEADVIWRDQELNNRASINKALAAAHIERPGLDPFWDAIELKMVMPGEPPIELESRNDGGESVIAYKGVEISRWRPAPQPLPQRSAAHLRQALRWLWPVHPDVAERIAAGGSAPEHLRTRVQIAFQVQTHDFQLIDSRWCDKCDAIPADAQPGLGVGGAFETEIAPVMVAAIQGKFKSPSSDDYLRRVDAALDRGATLEAFLWFLERLLQDGIHRCAPDDATSLCRVQNRLVEQMRTNADAQAMQRGLTTRSIAAAQAIAAMRDKVRDNGYYVDLASLNAVPDSALRFKSPSQEPLKTAERQMVSAIKGMPMVPAVYRDIGKIYFAAVDPRRAFLAWEMGEANPGRSSEADLWGFVEKIKAEARRRHPELF
jgi:hypothetical protein